MPANQPMPPDTDNVVGLQKHAGDDLQLTLRSRFQQQLRPGVRLQGSERGEPNTTLVLSLRARTWAGPRW